MSLTKSFIEILTGKNTKKNFTKNQAVPKLKISKDELREFLINNNLQGELLRDVTNILARHQDLSTYQAVEFLLDSNERSQ